MEVDWEGIVVHYAGVIVCGLIVEYGVLPRFCHYCDACNNVYLGSKMTPVPLIEVGVVLDSSWSGATHVNFAKPRNPCTCLVARVVHKQNWLVEI